MFRPCSPLRFTRAASGPGVPVSGPLLVWGMSYRLLVAKWGDGCDVPPMLGSLTPVIGTIIRTAVAAPHQDRIVAYRQGLPRHGIGYWRIRPRSTMSECLTAESIPAARGYGGDGRIEV